MLVYYFFNNLILFMLFIWYSKKTFSFIKLEKYDIVLLLFLSLIKSILNLQNSFAINLFVTIIIYYFISNKFFIARYIKRIIFISFFLIASFISEMLAYIILNTLFLYFNITYNQILFNCLGGAINIIFVFFIVFLAVKISSIKDIAETKNIFYLIILPIISIVIIFMIMNTNLINYSPALCVVMIIGLFIFNVLNCIGYVEILQSQHILLENEKLKNLELHYLLMEEKFDNSKKFLHDFKKHINILNGLVISKEYEKLKSYLTELSKEFATEENFIVTRNLLVDLAINAVSKQLLENDIKLKCDIRIKSVTPITDLDFNLVFSNVLENAIESCINSNGHFIKIKLDKIDDLIILKVINPCIKLNQDLSTLKPNKEYHGYGIKKIKKVVNKYDGTCTFCYDKDKNMFISTIIFNT